MSTSPKSDFVTLWYSRDERGSGAFGRNLTGFTGVNHFARNLGNLFIGRVWGSEQLGNTVGWLYITQGPTYHPLEVGYYRLDHHDC